MATKYTYVLTLNHPTVKGRFSTEAPNERAAIKNIVFRELQNRNRSMTDIRPKALLIASDIFEKHLYNVALQSMLAPTGPTPPTTRLVEVDSNEPESELDEQPVRRGDQEYPENPDEEETDV